VTSDDGELVEASRRGDRQAFRVLFDRYHRRVHAVATGMLRNREDALDVAQETFIKAYRSLGSFKGDSSFYTWLYRITVNLCIDARRREARHARLAAPAEPGAGDRDPPDVRDESPGVDPFEQAKTRELGAEVQSALSELTAEHRAVILLREVDGLSYDEISQIMQCAKGTVMSRLHYARRRLQARLRGRR
jgi:RNA polymerase sigma-70 factor (ECF subfamily)